MTRAEAPEPFPRAPIRAALAEDDFGRDVTTDALVPPGATGTAVVVAKQSGVAAGLEVARAVFAEVDPAVEFRAAGADGDRVEPGQELCRLDGPLRSLLAGERTAVNFLQRMGGVASLTAAFVAAVAGTRARVLATRKTAPGLRAFDLWAVRAGGGEVHRASLSEQVLVKANHLRAARLSGTAGSMAEVVARLVGAGRARVKVGIEVDDLGQLRAALVPGVALVLLDNFPPELCAEAVRLRAAVFPGGGADVPELEASGGITLATVRSYAETGVERISVGALTHSAPALDVSLRLLPAPPTA